MRSTLVILAASIAMLGASFTAPVAQADTRPDPCAGAVVQYEDDPCWTWTRDGNGRRGVTLKSGAIRVVGTCAFRKLDRRGAIDWTRTDRLRGDFTARNRRCK